MIRPARAEDANELSELMTQLGYDAAAPTIADRLRRRDARREVFVALCNDRVVGWAAVSVDEPFVEGFSAQLEGLVVEERARGGGIGAQLLSAAEEWARARCCSEMRVWSNVIRERAHAFYAREGYRTVKAQYLFRKTLTETNST
jgi:GNAT superfamily N-acetyltransferase